MAGSETETGETAHSPELISTEETYSAATQRIDLLLNSLQHSPTGRRDAIVGLVDFIKNRLSSLAEYIDQTSGCRERVVTSNPADLSPQLGQALLSVRPEPKDAGEFYRRSAPLIRDWLIERLDILAASTRTEDQTRARFVAWSKFHQRAAALPDDLREAYNLVFYAGLTIKEAAEILKRSADFVDMDTKVAARLLRPLFDQARGKV